MARISSSDAARLGLAASTRAKRRAKAPRSEDRIPPGAIVCRFAVDGTPRPWRAPTVTRNGHSFKDKHLLKWQSTVKRQARLAMGQRSPYGGPVRLVMAFTLRRRPGAYPDVANLIKGTEDALQGSVIVNDRQTRRIEASRTIGDNDGVVITVYAVEGER